MKDETYWHHHTTRRIKIKLHQSHIIDAVTTYYHRPEDLSSTTVQMCPAQNTAVSSFYAEINTMHHVHLKLFMRLQVAVMQLAETYNAYWLIIS